MSLLETIIDEFNERTASGSQEMHGGGIDVDPDVLAQFIEYASEGAGCLQETADCADPGAKDEPMLTDDEGGHLDALERIIAGNNLLPVAFLEEGVQAQKPVARIALKQSHRGLPAGSGWGTGWLVADDLLMTNNHVIASKAFAKTVRAEFNYQNKIDGTPETPEWYDLDPDDVFYTNAALDYTLVRVKCRRTFLNSAAIALANANLNAPNTEVAGDENDLVGFTPFPGGQPDIPAVSIPKDWRDRVRWPITFCQKPGARWGHLTLPRNRVLLRNGMHVNVIQHPRGRRKEIGVQQNQIDEIFGNVVRYTTDTEPGSSGSPVFNNGWDLLAIHHAGGRRVRNVWKNNQGIRIDRIVTDLRRQIPAGDPVLTELGI